MAMNYTLIIFTVLSFVFNFFRKNSKPAEFMVMIYMVILYSMLYLQNRILYSMCSGNIKSAPPSSHSQSSSHMAGNAANSPSTVFAYGI